MTRSFLAAALGSLICLPTHLAYADSPMINAGHDAEAPTVAVQSLLSARPVPQPLLRYQLLPAVADQQPGNAAVWYGKVKAEQNRFFSDRETWEEIYEAIKAPLASLEQYEILAYLAGPNNTLFYFLEQGSRCEDCNWQLPIRDERFYSILLPEIQETRTFARLLAARARKQIHLRDFDEAVRTLRCGFALGQHVAQSPTIVSGLVGQAIVLMMFDQLELMMQQPDCPNLYWAITALPPHLAAPDMGVSAERDGVRLAVPDLQEVGKPGQTAEHWNAQFDKLVEEVRRLNPSFWQEVFQDALLSRVLLIRGYPTAKKVLARVGYDAEEIDAMPTSQVVLAAALLQQQIVTDQQIARYYLSFPDAEAARKKEATDVRLILGEPPVLPFPDFFTPAIDAVIQVRADVERRIARLRIFEAIRHYAAKHNALPQTLNEIRDLPIPSDPVTGKAFNYEHHGEWARLWGTELPGRPLNFEIRLRRE